MSMIIPTKMGTYSIFYSLFTICAAVVVRVLLSRFFGCCLLNRLVFGLIFGCRFLFLHVGVRGGG